MLQESRRLRLSKSGDIGILVPGIGLLPDSMTLFWDLCGRGCSQTRRDGEHNIPSLERWKEGEKEGKRERKWLEIKGF